MRIVTVVALIAAGMLGVFLVKESRHSAALNAEVQSLKQAAGNLEAQLAREKADHGELRERHGLPPAPATPAVVKSPAPPKTDTTSLADTLRMLDERSTQLAEAAKVREDLEAHVKQLESRVQSLTQETERLTALEKPLREQADAATRRAAALEGELKTRDERLQKADLLIRDLRQQFEDRGRHASAAGKISEEFEDLNRRRDVYMTNVLRRYREVTDLYRTLSLRQEGPRDDLSRIQNAIGMAEEDLRQLQTLNAQARKLQKELEAARK